jgi:WD40 repeat protein
VLLWNLSPAKLSPPSAPPATLKVAKVTCLAFSPDGKTLVLGQESGTVVLWDVGGENPQKRATMKGHRGKTIRAVAYSPDGKTIVSGGEDGTVRLWESGTGGELLTLKETREKPKNAITALGFAANGTALAAGDANGAVRLWYAPPLAPAP